MKTFYVKDFFVPDTSDSVAIESCLMAAEKENSEVTVVFDGKDYLIDRAILISSNMCIVIDNCSIKQSDGVFDNVFRGNNLVINGIDPYGRPIDVTPLFNIKIIGKGNATVCGTDKNRVSYHPFYNEYQQMTGDFWGWRTHMFSFSFCDGFEMSGIRLKQTMGWAVSFDNCKNVYVHDMDIRSNVKNGDGINFRSGCHYCTVENITGFTSDDTVACTALSRGKVEKEFSRYLSFSEPYNCSHERTDGDIHHIKVKNIRTGGLHHGVICLAAHGNKVHDIEISDVIETGEGDREATVKIYTGYGDGYNKGDIYNIKIDNVVSEKAKYALMLACEAENIEHKNIHQNNPQGEKYFNK